MEGNAPSRPRRRRAGAGRWRRGHFRRIDDSSRGDVAGTYLFGGLEGLSLVAIVDALERRAVAAWVVSAVFFLGGVALVLPMFAGGEEGIVSLGWMTWGAVGATFGAGFWLAGIPYRHRPAGRVLHIVAILAATAPIALHLVGVL